MSVTKSISNTLLRILPLMDSSTTTAATGNANGGNGGVGSSVEIQGGDENGDATSLSSDSSCSSCVSSCPSFVNEREPLGPYRLVKTLGIGEFGKIKLGIHTETEQKVAIKVIKKNNDAANLAKVEREIQVLKSLRHPHIVKLIEVTETDTRLGIILEYASGGELFEYVLSHSSLEEDTARNLFAQLISSVNHMHMKGIVHRDLKLENLLFLDAEQTHIIVSDFGFANGGANNKDLLSTCCGSPTYAAPELVYPSGGYKGPAADVWSCGVILYCMVCGYLPFDDDPENPESANLHQLYQYIRSTGTPSFPGFVSDDAQDLIRKMLQHDPAKRCSVEAIINHPWLQAYRSTLFDMSAEQLEQQALDSIKKHQVGSPSASTTADQQNRHHHQTRSTNGHHRHHNQLSAIEETQHHQEEQDNEQQQQQQSNDEPIAAQPYKFLELNDSPHEEEMISQIQTQPLHNNAKDQTTQNDKDNVPAQSTYVDEQCRGVLEPGMDYKPLELTQVNNSTGQDQQNTKPVQNDEQENRMPPTSQQEDQGVLAQTQNGNQGIDQVIASEFLESKANHQQPSTSDHQPSRINDTLSLAVPQNEQQELAPSLQNNETQPLTVSQHEQQELTPSENKQEIPDQRGNGSTEPLQAVNGVEDLPETENKIEKLASAEDQHHELTPQKNQEHQELALIDKNPQGLAQENQHQELNQHNIQGESGLTQTVELSQPDNVDQKLDGQETQNGKENADGSTSQQPKSDQHEIEHQHHDHVEEEVKAVQIYNEQPPQHPMDTAPIATISADNETNATTKTTLSSHTDDKDLFFLPTLPPIPNGEETILHDSGIKEQQQQRKPSLRRQKKFRPSLTDDEPLPINKTSAINTVNTTTTTTTTTTTSNNNNNNDNEVRNIDQNKNWIRPSLLGKDDSTRYYSTMVQNDASASDRISNHAADSDDGSNDDDDNKNNTNNGRGKVQNLKSTSLPLLNHPSNTMGTAIDANTSTTNLNDAIKKYSNGASLPTSPRKHHKRFSSILSLNHTGPRPQRSQSTHLPKKTDFKNQEKESSSPTTTASSTKLPVPRRRTVTQTVKDWIHNKKKPFSKHHHHHHHHHHRPSSSSLSESSSSGEFDGHEHSLVGTQQHQQPHHNDDNDQQRRARQQQQQQQQQIQQYRTPSSPSSSVETPTIDQLSGMRTLPHAQGENLTSMAPGHLILALVRMLTALGIDVKHDSSYQLTCLRKSCHHQKHSFSKKRNSKPFTALTAPIYGPPELDHGHHVAFSVEICRSLLSDLHVIDIQLTEGDDLAFQFLRSKLLALLNLNA